MAFDPKASCRIQLMAKRQKPRRQNESARLQNSAARIFGVTTNILDTAYVLRDGRCVRFSTMGDHVDIFLAFPPREREELREAMDSELDISTSVFLKRTGSVRIAIRGRDVELDNLNIHFAASIRLTVAQMKKLREAAQALIRRPLAGY